MSAQNTASSAQADLRLLADYVVPLTSTDLVWPQAAIDIDTVSGRICAVGPEAELGPPPPQRQVLGGVLLPGFVNAHAHTPMSLLRGTGDGAELAKWLTDYMWPLETKMTPQHAQAGMLAGIAEMHLGGITTSCEMYAHEHYVIQAAEAAGHRLVMLPVIFSTMLKNGDPTKRLDEIDSVRAEYDSNLVTVGYGPHSLYSLAPEVVGEIATRACSYEVPLAIHLEETQQERMLIYERYDSYAVKLLESTGALGSHLMAAHGVWLSDSEHRAMANAGASVVHCPSSNLKLGSGVAPVAAMSNAGVRLTLGTDGPASNDRLDLWEEMRLAALLARGTCQKAGAVSASQTLSWATRAGGEALGCSDIGLLAPGAVADIVRVDIDSAAYVGVTADNLIPHIVFAGSRADITDVWIAGQQVVSHRCHTLLDVEAITVSARNLAQQLRSN